MPHRSAVWLWLGKRWLPVPPIKKGGAPCERHFSLVFNPQSGFCAAATKRPPHRGPQNHAFHPLKMIKASQEASGDWKVKKRVLWLLSVQGATPFLSPFPVCCVRVHPPITLHALHPDNPNTGPVQDPLHLPSQQQCALCQRPLARGSHGRPVATCPNARQSGQRAAGSSGSSRQQQTAAGWQPYTWSRRQVCVDGWVSLGCIANSRRSAPLTGTKHTGLVRCSFVLPHTPRASQTGRC